MKNTPFDYKTVEKLINDSGIKEIGKASIRELRRLVDNIEKETGKEFIRMEMGIPGLDAVRYGVEAEIEALRHGIASLYPDIDGTVEFRKEAARFVKLFLNVDVESNHCFPTVGSMQGGLASFITVSRIFKEKKTVLFLDPGFPVHKAQVKMLDIPYEGFDVYNYRGDKLRDKLEEYLSKGNIVAILYSNPNNPSWICFTENELKIIGELARKYDVIVIEDLAYFGMDFRKDISVPGIPPFQSTVANYMDNYILLISSSKIFSYAGQRIAMMVISDKLFNGKYENLKRYYGTDVFGRAMLYGTLYCLTAGVSHSALIGFTAILKKVNDGEYNFIDVIREYAFKAKEMKKYFIENGFYIVYDKDENVPLSDGFYFTIAYPGMSGEELLEKFLYYGISAISLGITGSERTEGLRICVSLVRRDQLPELERRLKLFNENHKNEIK